MKTVLITAFEPFDGERCNPSWQVAERLHQRTIAGAEVVALQLPCVFGASLDKLTAGLAAYQPLLTIALGQAGGRSEISLERVAINIDDARIPDNAGAQPLDCPIVTEGPAAYFSTLPVKAIVAALHAAGIPAAVSHTAGTYVCNHVMYGLLHQLCDSAARGGFIHIPYLPEQAVNHPGAASMVLETMVQAVEVAIETALTTEQDLRLVGGATH